MVERLVNPRYQASYADRPGRVTAIRGVIFQSDGKSTVGRLVIRPLEALDRWIVGILPRPGEPTLAMHAGIHVVVDGEREYDIEQLVGTLYLDFRSGLNWTPIEEFRERDRGGWDVTVPAVYFRGVDQPVVEQTVVQLNAIEGHPFIGEDCTAFIERAFAYHRMFADSPLLRSLGIGVRIGDPALPLLKRDAPLDPDARVKLQFEVIHDLPDARAHPESPNARNWLLRRAVPALLLGTAVGLLVERYSSSSRRSTPVSSTARKFLR
jgi:hypothetical protein